MTWTDEETFHFIELYHHARPSLWDTTHTYYKNKHKRHEPLMEIADSFGMDKADIEKMIKYLQSAFSRERKKELNSKKTGPGSEETYKSQWFAYEALMFLADKNKPRRTVDYVQLPVWRSPGNWFKLGKNFISDAYPPQVTRKKIFFVKAVGITEGCYERDENLVLKLIAYIREGLDNIHD